MMNGRQKVHSAYAVRSREHAALNRFRDVKSASHMALEVLERRETPAACKKPHIGTSKSEQKL